MADRPSAVIAVATNFLRVAEALRPAFEAESGYTLTLVGGSTGQLYGQILNGAPYDALLAADQARPALLQKAGLGLHRQTYARGLLTLLKAGGIADEDSLHSDFTHLAIANPALAPYGLAAQQALTSLGLWANLRARIVMGQNVGQAYALVASGNADLGFVARPYAQENGWDVPDRLYDPIWQDAVLLTQNQTARAFMSYLASGSAQAAIRAAGYGAL
jgi:molybdate transport system substrate-binding protein